MGEHPLRFLIVTWAGGGNVPPALALGRRLRTAGCRVDVAAHGSLQHSVEASGLQFHRCASMRPGRPDWPSRTTCCVSAPSGTAPRLPPTSSRSSRKPPPTSLWLTP